MPSGRMSPCSSTSGRRPNPFRPAASDAGSSAPSEVQRSVPRRGPPSNASASVASTTTASELPSPPRPDSCQKPPSAGYQEQGKPPEICADSDAGPGSDAGVYNTVQKERKQSEWLTPGGYCGEAPVDALGRPACMSTLEPTVASHLRDIRKLTFTPEDKAAHQAGAAGINGKIMPVDRYCETYERARKILPNSSTHTSMAFGRSEDPDKVLFNSEYEAMFEGTGGLTSFESHKRHEAIGKKCTHAKHADLIHDLVYENKMDEAHHIDPHIRRQYSGAAGMGKSMETGRKRMMKGSTEAQVGNIIHYQPQTSELLEGHATVKTLDKRAGVLSSDIWR